MAGAPLSSGSSTDVEEPHEWLRRLLAQGHKLFLGCKKEAFCVCCRAAFCRCCSHCCHRPHQCRDTACFPRHQCRNSVLTIVRDVLEKGFAVREDDLYGWYDCSDVQRVMLRGGDKALLVNPTMQGGMKCYMNQHMCFTCSNPIRMEFDYCSLYCTPPSIAEWVTYLCEADFYLPCNQNLFCVNCYVVFCGWCCAHHRLHQVIQFGELNGERFVYTMPMPSWKEWPRYDNVMLCFTGQRIRASGREAVLLRPPLGWKDWTLRLHRYDQCLFCNCTILKNSNFCCLTCLVSYEDQAPAAQRQRRVCPKTFTSARDCKWPEHRGLG